MSDSVRFGNVNGPVNTGDPVNQGGNQIVGAGNIDISGANRNTYGLDPEVLQALAELRTGLQELRLSGSERSAAEADLARVEEAGQDKPAAAGAFQSFLDRLRTAGALADAGSDFAEAARRVALWLGPLAGFAVGLF